MRSLNFSFTCCIDRQTVQVGFIADGVVPGVEDNEVPSGKLQKFMCLSFSSVCLSLCLCLCPCLCLCLAGWLVGWLAGWLAGSLHFILSVYPSNVTVLPTLVLSVLSSLCICIAYPRSICVLSSLCICIAYPHSICPFFGACPSACH